MKTVGLIGGIGPESTIEYYRLTIARYRERMGDGSYPPILINSIDLTRMLDLVGANRLPELTDYLLGEIEKLARAGASIGALAANTPHIVFEPLRQRSPIPLISIVEATCQAAEARGIRRAGLFGTRFTMQAPFYPRGLARAGIACAIPSPAEQDYIHEKYMVELVNGVFRPETRDRLVAIIHRLRREEGIDSVILGDGASPHPPRRAGSGDTAAGHDPHSRGGDRREHVLVVTTSLGGLVSPTSLRLCVGGALVVAFAGSARGFAQPSSPVAVDAALTVRLSAGKTTYALGELIPLELEFRGRADPDWYFSTEPAGRGTEQYLVTPADGFDDPLAEFYASGVGLAGSTLSSWHPADGQPLKLRALLNDRIRFTRPGDYRLVVTSSRLGRYSRQPAPALASDPISLHLEPANPEWAAAEAARAAAAIESRGSDAVREGLAVLRHLGTREAALALVRHHGAGGAELRFDVFTGLVASPHRTDIVQAMEARLDAGESISPSFVHDLSFLRSLLDLPVRSTTPIERFHSLKTLQCEYLRRFIRTIARRGPSADAIGAALAALEEPPDPECRTGMGPLLADNPSVAGQAFLSLPERTQELVLGHRWNAIGGPWIEPALEVLYHRWSGDSRIAGAGDFALRRLVELDAVRGGALVVDEIRTGAHGVTPDTLLSLAQDPLPGLDDALRKRYESARPYGGQAATMWLVARHGTAGLRPFVIGEIERNPACDLEAAALAYLLKHDPPPALRRLQPGFDRTRPFMCVIPPWSELAARYWDDAVETAVIAQLEGQDPGPVSQAARVLGTYGSARVRRPLVDRFVRWEAEWRGREKELDARWPSPADGPSSPDSPAMIENAIVNALLENRRIVLDSADHARVRSLCVTSSCRQIVDAKGQSHPTP